MTKAVVLHSDLKPASDARERTQSAIRQRDEACQKELAAIADRIAESSGMGLLECTHKWRFCIGVTTQQEVYEVLGFLGYQVYSKAIEGSIVITWAEPDAESQGSRT